MCAAPSSLTLATLSGTHMGTLPTWVRCWVHWGRAWQWLQIQNDIREASPTALHAGIAANIVGGHLPLVRLTALCAELGRELLRALDAKDALFHQGLSWAKVASGSDHYQSPHTLSEEREFSWLSPSLSLSLESVRTQCESWISEVAILSYRLSLNALRLSASLLQLTDQFKKRSEAEMQTPLFLMAVNAQAMATEFSQRGAYLLTEEFSSRARLITFVLTKLNCTPNPKLINEMERSIEQAAAQAQHLIVGIEAGTQYMIPYEELSKGLHILLYATTGLSSEQIAEKMGP